MPVAGLNSGVGDYVVWQQADGKPFTVTFPSGNTTFNTGSPFVNRLGSGWQTIFPSANGASYQTGQANRNGWEVITFVHDFYIQSITVDGKTCYDRQKNPIEDMKVIIDK